MRKFRRVGNNVNLCPAKFLIDCRYPKVLFQVQFEAQTLGYENEWSIEALQVM